MKILIACPYYKPGFKAGGPIQSIYNLAKLLGEDMEIYIFTQSIDFGSDTKHDNIQENIWQSFDNHKVYYCNPSKYGVKNLFDIIKLLQPNFVYFNSVFHKLTWHAILINNILRFNYKFIIAPRGELDSGALKLKAFKKRIFIKIFKIIIGNNIVFHATTLKELHNISKIFNKKIKVAENIPSLVDIKPIRQEKYRNNTNFVFISRISPKKNLEYCIKLLNDNVFEGIINFDIIGPIEDVDYWKLIESKIINVPANVKINYLGEVPNSELKSRTEKYHFLMFPTKSENYGHIIYECLSYGIPVLLSDQTPWEENNNGVFVRSLNDIIGFKLLIESLHKIDNEEFSAISDSSFNYARSIVNMQNLRKQYIELFDESNYK